MAVHFLIKHSSSGKFFHPYGGQSNPGNNTTVVLHPDRHDRMHWTFEPVEGHWGYIKHVTSGKVIHPYGGSLTPGNNTKLVLHGDRHYGALFALDAVNDHVIHKGGRFAHPYGGSPNPGNNTQVVLHSDVHDAMRFQFVSTTDSNKEVLVYGSPTMAGKWKIINLVKNPKAEHTAQLTIKVGKSKTETTTSSFQYRWEASGGINIEIFQASVSQSVQFMIEKTTSATWSEETTKTTTIKVEPGKTVVTWQYVFDVQQNDSRSIFRSNLLADTESEQIEPKDLQYKSV
ncbi:galactose-binding lectin-like [Amphiura filiformis]|uniref:galactose-binding lectin-like n=1 Tax=Amphiura filiformis TaxID=82378 RepID=UPI003B227F68